MDHLALRIFFACFVYILLCSRPVVGATEAEIDAALKKGIDFLYSKEKDGNWEIVANPVVPGTRDAVESGQWGGLTGTVTYALLAAEQDPQDKRITQAVDFLQNARMRGVYAIAMRAQVWPFMGKYRKVNQFALHDMQLLANGMKSKGPMQGEWFYYVDEPKDLMADHSASQFALLGIWACEEAGVEVPTPFWKLQDDIWRRDQMADGSWSYVYKDPAAWGQPALSMTLAGLASLYITQDKLVTSASRCTPLPADRTIDAGIQFVADHYPADWDNVPPGTFTPGSGRRQFYVLFGLSRLGLASGLRYFGKHDWFRDGADYLVKAQQPDGSWGGTWETSFAILFLARGRAPVAYNKLEYTTDKKPPVQEWNMRPRDVANLAGWTGKSLERRINWQVVNINSDPDDWLDAPILYISGTDDLKFNEEQVGKLRRFVESGGLILGNPDCNSAKFAAAFRKLGQLMFPMYEWTELPATSPIYTREQFVRTKWKAKPHVLSLSNGVRVLMAMCPEADLGRTYAVQDDRSKPEAYQLGLDLCEYVGGFDLRHRGDTLLVTPDPAIKSTRTLKLARLKYTGNWDPEPAGWRRLGSILHNDSKMDLSVEPVNLGSLLKDFSLAHLTGTASLTLTPDQKQALVDYVKSGGTLLVDSAGGNNEFAAAIVPQLESAFAETFSVLPPEAPIYTQFGPPIQNFVYTRLARATLGTLKTPRIKAIVVNNRPAVLFSGDDLSMGLVGQPVDGVIGYAPATASQVAEHILLFSENVK